MMTIAVSVFIVFIVMTVIILSVTYLINKKKEHFAEEVQMNVTQDKVTMQDLVAGNLQFNALNNLTGSINFIKDDKAYFPYARVDQIQSMGGNIQGTPVLDPNTKQQTGSSFVSKGVHVNSSFITNTTFDKSTTWDNIKSDKMVIDTVSPKHLNASNVNVSELTGDDSKFTSLGADLVTLKTLQADIVKPASIQSESITISGRLQSTSDNNTFDIISGNLSSDIMQGSEASFNNMTASRGSFANKLTTSKNLCVNDACLSQDSINKLLSKSPYPESIFKGATSTLNKEGIQTEFPNNANTNIIAGDTKIYGNTKVDGDVEIGSVLKFKNANNTFINEIGDHMGFTVSDAAGNPTKAFTLTPSKVDSVLPFYTNSLWSDDGISIYTQGKSHAAIDASGRLTVDKELCLKKGNNLRCMNADDIPLYREKKDKGAKGDKGDTGDFDTSKPIENKTGINLYAPIKVDRSMNLPMLEKTTDNGGKYGLSHSSTDNVLRLYSTNGSINLMDDVVNISNTATDINGNMNAPQVDIASQLCVGNTCINESDMLLIKSLAK